MSESLIRTVRFAICETITRAGLKCEPYEEFTLPRTPVATLLFETASITEWDQKFGWETITYRLRNYHSFGGSARKVDEALDADMRVIINALGEDRTLDGRVVDIKVISVNRYYDVSPAPKYGWGEWLLEVTPYANLG